MSDTPLVEIKDLRVDFPIVRGPERLLVRAVRGVSFSVARGEILGLVGESGSGKSVTVSAIPGLLPPRAVAAGSIRFEGTELLGRDVRFLRSWRGRRIGMVFQEPGRSYDPLQSVGSAFHETFRVSEPRLSRKDSDDRAIALLEEVGLAAARERLVNFPHQFSGGQLQRIGIALALAQGCDLLLADEPTTALDVTIQAQIVDLLRKLRASRGIAIVFISHNLDLVAGIADRIAVMYGGLVLEEAPAAELVSAPRHPYAAGLLAAAPAFGSHWTTTSLAPIPGRVCDPTSPEPGCPFAPRCSLASRECAAAIPELRPVAGGRRLTRCIKDTEYGR